MNRGYIKIWRKIQDNPLWKEPRKFSRAEAWIDIVMEVQGSPEPKEVLIGNSVLMCNRGESLKSLDTWAKRWSWDKSATRRFFILLKKMGNIDTASERKTTRLKVINYDTYNPLRNANETQVKHKRNASETQVTPENKVNKVNKGKKEKINTNGWDKKASGVLRYFNRKKKSKYRDATPIVARLKEGCTMQECLTVIDNKFEDDYFKENPRFLNPTTLFRKSHWDKYLNDTPPEKHPLAGKVSDVTIKNIETFKRMLTEPE
jgi:uncharacterized phage protein (TIGR02220 family)